MVVHGTKHLFQPFTQDWWQRHCRIRADSTHVEEPPPTRNPIGDPVSATAPVSSDSPNLKGKNAGKWGIINYQLSIDN
jgi:hypothetical protein